MKNLVYVTLIFLILFSSCSDDSSLSDVELTDPSIIRPVIELNRSWDDDGQLTTKIKVFLWDKNSDLIELKKGNVSVNGQLMHTEDVLTGGQYYTIDESMLQVGIDELYTFVIELADEEQYEASITTQDVDLYELNLPANYNKTNDMEINWQGPDIQNEFQIHLACRYTEDNGSGYSNHTFTPNQQERENGAYTIPKSYFNQPAGIYEAIVLVKSEKEGAIDSRFRDNSKISSEFEKESKCDVN